MSIKIYNLCFQEEIEKLKLLDEEKWKDCTSDQYFDYWFFYVNEFGELHCETGPARYYKDGCMEYRINSKLHRLDGPAFIKKDLNGRLYEEFFVNGFYVKRSEYRNHPDVITYQYIKKHPELKAFT